MGGWSCDSFCYDVFFLSIFIRLICSHCTTPRHLALNNTTRCNESWYNKRLSGHGVCSLARSTLQVWMTFISLAIVVVETAVAVHAATNLSRLYKAIRTGDLRAARHLRHHKPADLPLQLGAELTARCHLLPGSWQSRRSSTIQLAEGGHLLLPLNSDHLA